MRAKKVTPIRASRHSVVETVQEPTDGSPDFAPVTGPWPHGNLEMVSQQAICGWVWDPERPDERLDVEILDGDRVIIRIPAAHYREDLKAAGIGDGKHGFALPNPSALLKSSRHRISVRVAGIGATLSGSPQVLINPATGLDRDLVEVVDTATTSSIETARAPEDLDEVVTLTLRMLNRLFNARQALADKPTGASDPQLQALMEQADVSDWTRELIAKVQASYAPLHFEVTEEPLVSIVIPVFNKFSVTYDCLRSISENLPFSSFEIILVDDASQDETIFAGLPGVIFSGAVRVIRNTKNVGFVQSTNTGAAAARGRFLLFLNNDTIVQPGWLDELAGTFEAMPDVGIVGAKLLSRDGALQEAGGIVWRLGEGGNWGRNADPKDPRYCYLRDVDYVSGAALMIERATFEQLQGFDPLFSPGYYEDTDLCFRVRALGKRVVMQPASQIVHLEGVSAGTDVRGSGMKRYQAINQRKFFERWNETLAVHRFVGQEADLDAERSVKRRALFIDNTVPTPDQDAGSNAALQHMLALQELGYKVTFLPADNMAQINPHTANLQKLGIECLYAPYYWSVEEVMRKARVQPDLVYMHRYSNASKYANLVRQHFPKARILYNVADLHFLRQQREMAVEGGLNGVHPISAEAEIAAMRQVDAVIVHSPVEKEVLRQKDPSLNVFVIPWTVRVRPAPLPLMQRLGYAFIGGYGHRPNVDAAVHLARDIVPDLRLRNPQMPGYLVGSRAPSEVTSLESQNLRVLGYVPDLTRLLHRLRCTVAPLRYGAGIKGKVLESFAHGLPSVMTEVAAEGLDLPKSLRWLVAKSSHDLAEKLAIVHEDSDLNGELSQAGLDYIAERYAPQAVARMIGEASFAAATR